MEPFPAHTFSRQARVWLFVILVVSAALRVCLASRGGQAYWPDEGRYETTRQATAALLRGDWTVAGERLLGSSDHLLFRFIGLVPALLEQAIFPAEAIPQGFAAGFFSLFGVGAIGLVWLIARRETDDEATATWCAFFYAGCVTGFFFSRHYFPYDPAICLLLLGWWQGLRSRTPWQHGLTGACVGLGYLTYNAYWNFGAVILVAHTLHPRPGQARLARAAWSGSGLLAPIVVLYAAARLLGHDLIAHAREFAHTVTQGGFGQGWRYLPEYFTVSEGPYAGLLIALGVAGSVHAFRRRTPALPWWWLGMGGLLAAEMIFFSDIIPRFALSGRMVKPLGLFLALGAGLGAGLLGLHRNRLAATGLAALTVLLAAMNFRQPLSLVFPRDFRLQAEKVIAAERERDPGVALQMYYADFMHRAWFITEYPPHTVLLRHLHPLQFRPYQFEGYDAPTRHAFQDHDFSMRLVRLTHSTGWQNDLSQVGADLHPYAGAIEMDLKLPHPRPAGHSEPLVVAGGPGRADLLSLHYLDAEQVELILDHWGWGAVRSAPFRIPADDTGPQHVTVCSGSLLPPSDHPVLQRDPDLRALAGQIVVNWNNRPVFRESLPLYSTPVLGVTLGGNYVGGTTANIEFTGRILRARQVDPRLLMSPDRGVKIPSLVGHDLPPATGALAIGFDWDVDAAQQTGMEIALLAAGHRHAASLLTIRPVDDRFVLSAWVDGRRIAESPPILLPMGSHRAEIWSPSLNGITATGNPATTTLAAWQRNNLLVKLDGRVLLRAVTPAAAVSEQEASYLSAGRPWPLDDKQSFAPLPGTIRELTPIPTDGAALLHAMWQDRLNGTPPFADTTGPLRLRIRLPVRQAGSREPLLSTGRTGEADVLFLSYETDGRLRIGHDHWGWELLLSEPFTPPPDGELSIDISLGSLYPSSESPWARAPHTATSRRGRVHVAINGRIILDAEREFYLAPASSVAVGQNVTGASTCGPEFTGTVIEIRHLDPAVDLPTGAHRDALR